MYDESGNKELEDDRDSQDEISVLPPSRYASRAPSMAPSRTHSMSNTPQTSLSPVEDHSAVGTQMSRSLSTDQPHGERHPDGLADPPVTKKSKSSSPRSHSKPSQQLSPNPSTLSHHTSRTERSQNSPRSSQHPSHHSTSSRELPNYSSPREPPNYASPRELPQHSTPPREPSRNSPSPRELSHHPVSQPVSREPSQLSHQSGTATPASTVLLDHRDREIPRGEHDILDQPSVTPTPSQHPQSQQPTPSGSVLDDSTSNISRAHSRSKSVVTATQPADQAGIKFPSVSTMGSPSPYETPAPRSAVDSRKTSLTPSDSASNIHVNHIYGSGTVPGSVVGSVLPESTLSKRSKKDKNRSALSTITSASHSTTKPPTEQPQSPVPAPSVPQISIPASPSVSSSFGSRLTTPLNTRSLKPSFTSSLSYATDHPEQPPPQPPAMSRQNSDTGGLGGALGGVLTGVWGAYRSATASPTVENPPPGPATAAFESTLETIEDVEVPGAFGGEREREAPVPPQEEIPEPVVVPPSLERLEEPVPPKVPTPQVEITDLPASEPVTVPQTPVEPEPSVLSVADKKKARRQRDKERKEKEAQEQKDRMERGRVEREEREARERMEREEHEEKKRQEKAEREAKKKREREERERQEQEERAEKERIEKEAHEQAEREAREQAEREAREQAEREAREQADREVKEREAKERAEREAREQAEKEAKEQAERAAMEKMDKVTRRRAEREAAKRAEQEAKEKAEREEQERAEEAARVKAERIAKRKAEKEAKEQAEREAKEKAEQEAKEKAEQEEKERVEEAARAKAERTAKRKAEREAKEQAEREAKEKAEQEAREKAEKEAREQAEGEVRERAEREAKEIAEKERLEREERNRAEKERVEKEREEKERAEREAEEKADREAKEREEKKKTPASKIPSAWGSTVGKNDRSRKTSSLSQKEQKNEWANTWDPNSADREKEDHSGLFPLTTPAAPGLFEGVGNFDFLSGKKDSPGGVEELELRTPLTKKGKTGTNSISKAVPLTETTDVGKLDMLEDLNMNDASARVSVSSRSENERWTDAEQGPSPTEPAPPALALGPGLETLSGFAPEFLMAPNEAKDEAPATPKPWPAPSLTPARQSPVPAPVPAPAKIEPEKPLSLWERKKLKVASPPAPASSLFGGGDGANSSGIWGDVSGGGNTESIVMPAIAGDRQSVFTDTARDQKRENQRENVVEGLLGSSPARRRNDSAQSQMTTKPTPKSTPTTASPPAQKSSGWGSWGTSLLNIASTIAAPDRSPSPEPPPVKPKIEDPPRGFTPTQPPKSQPVGFGSLNKPAWGAGGGSGDNSAWSAAKPGPTPIAQKTSTGPAWGSKPAGSTFGSGTTGWGSGTGPTFSSGVGKNLTVDTATKPLESSPNTAGPENIPESAVEIKHVPAPGRFGSAITDQQEVAGAQYDAWGLEEAAGTKDAKKTSKDPSPVRESIPEPPTEVTEEPAKTEETATPAEEEEFDWANTRKKKGKVASVANTPSVPNTPDPDNADDGGGGGTGPAKGKKKRKGKK